MRISGAQECEQRQTCHACVSVRAGTGAVMAKHSAFYARAMVTCVPMAVLVLVSC
jgi:hypothetical protein